MTIPYGNNGSSPNWWLTHTFEKYSCEIEQFSPVGLKMINIWNHLLTRWALFVVFSCILIASFAFQLHRLGSIAFINVVLNYFGKGGRLAIDFPYGIFFCFQVLSTKRTWCILFENRGLHYGETVFFSLSTSWFSCHLKYSHSKLLHETVPLHTTRPTISNITMLLLDWVTFIITNLPTHRSFQGKNAATTSFCTPWGGVVNKQTTWVGFCLPRSIEVSRIFCHLGRLQVALHPSSVPCINGLMMKNTTFIPNFNQAPNHSPRKLQHTPISHTPGNPLFANYERNPGL